MQPGCTPWPAGVASLYRELGWWRGESLGELLHTWARQYGERVALVDAHSRVSYAELDRRVQRMAYGFVRTGVRPGDRVIVQLPNVCEFVTVVFALIRAGAIPVYCLISHRSAEVGHLFEVSGAVGYVAPRTHRGFDYVALGARLLAERPERRWMFVLDDAVAVADYARPALGIVPLAAVDGDPVELPDPDPSDAAFFLLSGGTTALPKLIPRTHDDYAYQLRETATVCELSGDDVYLAALPLEFNFTWGCPGVLGTLAVGGRVVLAADPTPEQCFALIAAERVTVTSLVPTLVRLWIEAAEWTEADVSSLRLVQVGGAKLAPELAAQVEPALGCRLMQVYGMAEGLLCMSRTDDDRQSILETQGTPLSPGDEVRIVDAHGLDLPTGATGELLVRGPYTLRGYYNADEHNRRAFTQDGFYRSGDLARLTPAGHVVVDGRVKDIVIRGGNKIASGEVENHLVAHPNVAAAAVVPVPDEYLGERICAFIVGAGEPPTLLQLKRALLDRGLAEFKLPDRVEVLESFPLTPLGKVDKKALAALATTPARKG